MTPRWSLRRTVLTGGLLGGLVGVLVAGLAGGLAWWQGSLISAAVGLLVGCWGASTRRRQQRDQHRLAHEARRRRLALEARLRRN